MPPREPLNDFERVLVANSNLSEQEVLDLKDLFGAVSSGKPRVTSAKQAVHTLSILGFSQPKLEDDGSLDLLPGGRLSVLTEHEFLQCAARLSDEKNPEPAVKKARTLFRMLAPHQQERVTPSMASDFMKFSGCEPPSTHEAVRLCQAISRRGENSVTSIDMLQWVRAEENRSERARQAKAERERASAAEVEAALAEPADR